MAFQQCYFNISIHYSLIHFLLSFRLTRIDFYSENHSTANRQFPIISLILDQVILFPPPFISDQVSGTEVILYPVAVIRAAGDWMENIDINQSKGHFNRFTVMVLHLPIPMWNGRTLSFNAAGFAENKIDNQ